MSASFSYEEARREGKLIILSFTGFADHTDKAALTIDTGVTKPSKGEVAHSLKGCKYEKAILRATLITQAWKNSVAAEMPWHVALGTGSPLLRNGAAKGGEEKEEEGEEAPTGLGPSIGNASEKLLLEMGSFAGATKSSPITRFWSFDIYFRLSPHGLVMLL